MFLNPYLLYADLVLHKQRTTFVRQNSHEINHKYDITEIVLPCNNLSKVKFHDPQLFIAFSSKLTRELLNSLERIVLKRFVDILFMS